MKHSSHMYAKALAEVVAFAKPLDGTKIVKNFLALIRKNGDEAHLGKIVEEAARLARARKGIRKVSVESARPLTAAQEKIVAKFLKADDVVDHKIDLSLIAGVRLVLNDEMQFDGSLRGKLDQVFRNI